MRSELHAEYLGEAEHLITPHSSGVDLLHCCVELADQMSGKILEELVGYGLAQYFQNCPNKEVLSYKVTDDYELELESPEFCTIVYS